MKIEVGQFISYRSVDAPMKEGRVLAVGTGVWSAVVAVVDGHTGAIEWVPVGNLVV